MVDKKEINETLGGHLLGKKKGKRKMTSIMVNEDVYKRYIQFCRENKVSFSSRIRDVMRNDEEFLMWHYGDMDLARIDDKELSRGDDKELSRRDDKELSRGDDKELSRGDDKE